MPNFIPRIVGELNLRINNLRTACVKLANDRSLDDKQSTLAKQLYDLVSSVRFFELKDVELKLKTAQTLLQELKASNINYEKILPIECSITLVLGRVKNAMKYYPSGDMTCRAESDGVVVEPCYKRPGF